MLISLDTNIFLFGLRNQKPSCNKLLDSFLSWKSIEIEIIISDEVRKEVTQNLSPQLLKLFYLFEKNLSNFQIDYEKIPTELIQRHKDLGLKKGDAVIGAFCDLRKVDVFVSENRHFLQEVEGLNFQIMSAEEFCNQFL